MSDVEARRGTWAEALDRLDRDLDAAWVAVGAADLAGAVAAVAALGAGLTELPPLPAELIERATGVVARIDDLATAVDDARAETRRELQALERLAPAEAAVPRYIDRRA